jgi:hypothetical protein
LQAQRLQRVVRVAPRPKAVTAVEEIRFEHGLDNARYRSLQQPIRDRGDPQWARSGFAWAFGYFNPPDRWGAIGAGSKLCANLFDLLLQLALKLLGALPVDPAGRAPVLHAPRFREEFRCQQVRQLGESHRTMPFGLLRYLTLLR